MLSTLGAAELKKHNFGTPLLTMAQTKPNKRTSKSFYDAIKRMILMGRDYQLESSLEQARSGALCIRMMTSAKLHHSAITPEKNNYCVATTGSTMFRSNDNGQFSHSSG